MKYLNLGNSVLITGGLVDNIISNACYILKYQYNSIVIDEFPPMKSKRRSHNGIFIPEKELILVCGGWSNSTCETLILSNRKWNNIANLNRVRVNASLAFINEKFVYCISGFDNVNNKYLNSCEYLDLSSPKLTWGLIEFQTHGIDYKMTLPGVIQLDSNKVLLCGGYEESRTLDTKTYLFEVNNNENKISLNHYKKLPDEGTFFPHNSFCANLGIQYNFCIKQDLYMYDTESFYHIKKE